jgi:glycosyltransferase involved in cell wall biosynthesis
MESIMLVATLALWAAGFLLLTRLGRCHGAGSPERTPVVSVIIPARNEEHNLPTLLRSLATQPLKPHEIIVVDDGSTDRTAELARQLGAMVVASKPLPEGWRGKTWACHQGARTPGLRLAVWLAFFPATRVGLSRSDHITPSANRTRTSRFSSTST